MRYGAPPQEWNNGGQFGFLTHTNIASGGETSSNEMEGEAVVDVLLRSIYDQLHTSSLRLFLFFFSFGTCSVTLVARKKGSGEYLKNNHIFARHPVQSFQDTGPGWVMSRGVSEEGATLWPLSAT